MSEINLQFAEEQLNKAANCNSDMLDVVYLGVQPTPYTHYLLQHLKRSPNINMTVFFSRQEVSDLPWKSKLTDEDDSYFKKFLGIDWRILLHSVSDKYSLFYVVGYNDPTKFLVLLLRRLLNYPYCYFTDSIKTERNKYSRLKSLTLPFLFRNAKAILTTGEFGIRRLRGSNYCSPETKLLNLPFFVPFPDLSNKRKVTDKINFLCSGRLVDAKGFDLVIEAFKICKERGYTSFSLSIAGTGNKQKQLQELVKSYGLESNISFLGWLEPDQMQTVMLKTDVFIHFVPSLDPFPVAVLEAMAAGIPVIGSDMAGSVVERVKNGENGFVISSTDIEGLTESLIKFIANPSLIENMSYAARQTAEEWPVERAEQVISSIENKNCAFVDVIR